MKSWIRIRIEVIIRRVCRPAVVDSHHFDEEQGSGFRIRIKVEKSDPDLQIKRYSVSGLK
jgi:hypothetical protein